MTGEELLGVSQVSAGDARLCFALVFGSPEIPDESPPGALTCLLAYRALSLLGHPRDVVVYALSVLKTGLLGADARVAAVLSSGDIGDPGEPLVLSVQDFRYLRFSYWSECRAVDLKESRVIGVTDLPIPVVCSFVSILGLALRTRTRTRDPLWSGQDHSSVPS